MNNKITLASLVAMLALKTGMSKEKSEEFIKYFFQLISESLEEGESVKIKTLGTFKIINIEARKSISITTGEEIEIPEHRRIVFVPSREIAEVVNAPFSMFESVELHPDAEREIEEAENPKSFKEETTEECALDATDGSSAVIISSQSSPNDSTKKLEDEKEIKDEIKVDDQENPMTPSDELPSEYLIEIESRESMKKGSNGLKFWVGFICGLLVELIFFALGYFFFYDKIRMKEEKSPLDEVKNEVGALPSGQEKPDSINSNESNDSISPFPKELPKNKIGKNVSEIPPTRPSDEEARVVKDVIGPHNYLTTMAQRHYGNFHLWAYIYEENKSFLGHPDRIKPGTAVVVPPLSKYGVDPNNPEDIRKAKQLGIEIYQRFK